MLCLGLICTADAQKVLGFSKVYREAAYTAFWNDTAETSTFVIYRLYKGGGNVPRTGMKFRAHKGCPHFAYARTGYDKGHLANAEDFAYDRRLELSTFMYYNAVPQAVRLNRGIWKTYEEKVRAASQTDSLLVICGGCDWTGPMPARCFKMVWSMTDGHEVMCVLFENDQTERFWDRPALLERQFSYKKVKSLFDIYK